MNSCLRAEPVSIGSVLTCIIQVFSGMSIRPALKLLLQVTERKWTMPKFVFNQYLLFPFLSQFPTGSVQAI